MRSCKMPRQGVVSAGNDGEWTCSCGNLNYAGKTVCNLRKCGLPKPGTKGGVPRKGSGKAAKGGDATMAAQMMMMMLGESIGVKGSGKTAKDKVSRQGPNP